MRSEDEIREKIIGLKNIIGMHELKNLSYYICKSGVKFLEWVLEDTECQK